MSKSKNKIEYCEYGPSSFLSVSLEQFTRICATEVLAMDGYFSVLPIKTILIVVILIAIRDIRINIGVSNHAVFLKTSLSCGLNYGDALLYSLGLEFAIPKSPSSLLSTSPYFPNLIKNVMFYLYNDIDIYFGVKVSSSEDYDEIKSGIFDVNFDHLPILSLLSNNANAYLHYLIPLLAVEDASVSKLFEFNLERDNWTLITIVNCTTTLTQSKSKNYGSTAGPGWKHFLKYESFVNLISISRL